MAETVEQWLRTKGAEEGRRRDGTNERRAQERWRAQEIERKRAHNRDKERETKGEKGSVNGICYTGNSPTLIYI